ncbi:MAG TPA: sigma-70 family RNA polymerase sigma factor [Candidatus Hydrogenedentes bacterium]|nr:sigma-70 family RNA polymerase sigma factor [Candidatus Hydrogenedentota bacterium]
MSSTVYKKDKALIEACIHGESGSWDEFIREYGRLLRSIAYGFERQLSMVGLDADDLKGHIYEKLLENGCGRLLAWKGRAKFSTFLVMVVRNLALDFLAKHTKGPFLERPVDIPEQGDTAVSIEEMELTRNQLSVLRDALMELPERQGVVLRMRLEGKTLREISYALNRPAGTISVENSRATKALRKKLRIRFPELWEGEDL